MTESLSQTQLIEDTNRFGKHNGANRHTNDATSSGGFYSSNNHSVEIDNYIGNGASRRSSVSPPSTTLSTISSSALSSNIYTLVLKPFNSQFPVKTLELDENEKCRIGRQSSAKTVPRPLNGYFNSKVLSRNHAVLWADSQGVWVKDTKSSNGTFLNGHRLSAELEESEPFELKTGDEIEFGIDITGDDGAILYHKVACSVSIFNLPVDQMDRSTLKEFNLDGGWLSEIDVTQQRRSSTSSVSTISEPPGKTTITNHSSKSVAKQNKQWELLLATLEAEWNKSQDVEKELRGLKDAIGEMKNTHNDDRLKKLIAQNTSLHDQLAKANQQLDEYKKKSRLQDQAILSAKKQLVALQSSSKTKSRNAGMDGSNGVEWQQQLEQARLALAEEKRKHSKDMEIEKALCSEYEQKCKALESRLLVLEQDRSSLVKPSPTPQQQPNHETRTFDFADALQIRPIQILIAVMMAIISSLIYALLIAS